MPVKVFNFANIAAQINDKRNPFFSIHKVESLDTTKGALEKIDLKFLSSDEAQKLQEHEAKTTAAFSKVSARPTKESISDFMSAAKETQKWLEEAQKVVSEHKETRLLKAEVLKNFTIDALFSAIPAAIHSAHRDTLEAFLRGALELGGVDATLINTIVGGYHIKGTLEGWKKNPGTFFQSIATNATDDLDIASLVTLLTKLPRTPPLSPDVEAVLEGELRKHQAENNQKMDKVAHLMLVEIQKTLGTGLLPSNKEDMEKVQYMMDQVREYKESLAERLIKTKDKGKALEEDTKKEIKEIEKLQKSLETELKKITIWQEAPKEALSNTKRDILSNLHVMAAVKANKTSNLDETMTDHQRIKFLSALHKQTQIGKAEFERLLGFGIKARVEETKTTVVDTVKSALSEVLPIEVEDKPRIQDVTLIERDIKANMRVIENKLVHESFKLFQHCRNDLLQKEIMAKTDEAIHQEIISRRKALVETLIELQRINSDINSAAIEGNIKSIDVYCTRADKNKIWKTSIPPSDIFAQKIILGENTILLEEYQLLKEQKSLGLPDDEEKLAFLLNEMLIRHQAKISGNSFSEILAHEKLLTQPEIPATKKTAVVTNEAPKETDLNKKKSAEEAAKKLLDPKEEYDKLCKVVESRIETLNTIPRKFLLGITESGKADQVELSMLSEKLTIAQRLHRDFSDNPLGFSSTRNETEPLIIGDEQKAIAQLRSAFEHESKFAELTIESLGSGLIKATLKMSNLEAHASKEKSEKAKKHIEDTEKLWAEQSTYWNGTRVKPNEEGIEKTKAYAQAVKARTEAINAALTASKKFLTQENLDPRAIHLAALTPKGLDRLIEKINQIEKSELLELSSQLKSEVAALRAEIAISMIERLKLMAAGKVPDLVQAAELLSEKESSDVYSLSPEKVREYYDFVYQYADEATIQMAEKKLPPNADIFLSSDKSYEAAEADYLAALKQEGVNPSNDFPDTILESKKTVEAAKELDSSYRAHKRTLPKNERPKTNNDDQKEFQRFLRSNSKQAEVYKRINKTNESPLPSRIQEEAVSHFVKKVAELYHPVRLMNNEKKRIDAKVQVRLQLNKTFIEGFIAREADYQKAYDALQKKLNTLTKEQLAQKNEPIGFFQKLKNIISPPKNDDSQSKIDQVKEEMETLSKAYANLEEIEREKHKLEIDTKELNDDQLLQISTSVFERLLSETKGKLAIGALTAEDLLTIKKFINDYGNDDQKNKFARETSFKRAFLLGLKNNASVEQLESLYKSITLYEANEQNELYKRLLSYTKGEYNPKTEKDSRWAEFKDDYYRTQKVQFENDIINSNARERPLTKEDFLATEREFNEEIKELLENEPFTVRQWLERLLARTGVTPENLEKYVEDKIVQLLTKHLDPSQASQENFRNTLKNLCDSISDPKSMLQTCLDTFKTEQSKQNGALSEVRLTQCLSILLEYHSKEEQKEFIQTYVNDFFKIFLAEEKKFDAGANALLQTMMSMGHDNTAHEIIYNELRELQLKGHDEYVWINQWNPELAKFIEKNFPGTELAREYCLARLEELCYADIKDPATAKKALDELGKISNIHENLNGTELMENFLNERLLNSSYDAGENTIPPSYVSEMIVSHFGSEAQLVEMHNWWLVNAIESTMMTDYNELENGESIILDIIDRQDSLASIEYKFGSTEQENRGELFDENAIVAPILSNQAKMKNFLGGKDPKAQESIEYFRARIDEVKDRIINSKDAGAIDTTKPINDIAALTSESEAVVKLANSAFLSKMNQMLSQDETALAMAPLEEKIFLETADRYMAEADLRLITKAYLDASGLALSADEEHPDKAINLHISALNKQALDAMNTWLLMPANQRTEERKKQYEDAIKNVENAIVALTTKLAVQIDIKDESNLSAGIGGMGAYIAQKSIGETKATATDKEIAKTRNKLIRQKEALVALKKNMEKLIGKQSADLSDDIEMQEIAKKDRAASSAVSNKGFLYEKDADLFYTTYLNPMQDLAAKFIDEKLISILSDSEKNPDEILSDLEKIKRAMIMPIVALDERHVNPLVDTCITLDDHQKNALRETLVNIGSHFATVKQLNSIKSIFPNGAIPEIISDYINACQKASDLRTKMESVKNYFEFEKSVAAFSTSDTTDLVVNPNIPILFTEDPNLTEITGLEDRVKNAITILLNTFDAYVGQGKIILGVENFKELIDKFGSEEHKKQYTEIVEKTINHSFAQYFEAKSNGTPLNPEIQKNIGPLVNALGTEAQKATLEKTFSQDQLINDFMSAMRLGNLDAFLNPEGQDYKKIIKNQELLKAETLRELKKITPLSEGGAVFIKSATELSKRLRDATFIEAIRDINKNKIMPCVENNNAYMFSILMGEESLRKTVNNKKLFDELEQAEKKHKYFSEATFYKAAEHSMIERVQEILSLPDKEKKGMTGQFEKIVTMVAKHATPENKEKLQQLIQQSKDKIPIPPKEDKEKYIRILETKLEPPSSASNTSPNASPAPISQLFKQQPPPPSHSLSTPVTVAALRKAYDTHLHGAVSFQKKSIFEENSSVEKVIERLRESASKKPEGTAAKTLRDFSIPLDNKAATTLIVGPANK